MRRKLAFYEQYGVEEYYILDPDFARHKGYLRADAGKLEPIPNLFGWISPRPGIRFEMTPQMKEVLRIVTPDGRLFQPYTDIARKLDLTGRQIEQERRRANQAPLQVEGDRRRVERLLAPLRASGIEPEV